MKNRSMGGGLRVDGKRSRGLFGFFSFLSCVCSLRFVVLRGPHSPPASSQQVFFFYLKRQLSQSIYSRL
jgi:hypothetical protein